MHGCAQNPPKTQERHQLPLGEVISEYQGTYEEEGELGKFKMNVHAQEGGSTYFYSRQIVRFRISRYLLHCIYEVLVSMGHVLYRE